MFKTTILALYQAPQTVFTTREISLLFPDVPYANLRRRLTHLVKSEQLLKLRRGIYAKEKYDELELANKIYAPSYISLETVLRRAGIIFQYYEHIYALSYLSRTVEAGGQTFVYRKIKNEILLNKQGIEENGNINIASPERAFLDGVFLWKNYYFDNLRPLNWDKVMELRKIYNSRIFDQRVEEYYQIYKEDHA